MALLGINTRQLGEPLPPGDIHGVSVNLPTWEDTVGWSSRNPRVLALLKTGYPRFFIHRLIDELAEQIVKRLHTYDDYSPSLPSGEESLLGMLFPCKRSADQCGRFLRKYLPEIQARRVTVLSFCKGSNPWSRHKTQYDVDWENLELHAVLYSKSAFRLAKLFWQHTGFGISSRYAVLCLENQHLLSLQHMTTPCLSRTDRCNTESGSRDGTKGLDLLAAGDVDSSKAILRQRIAELCATVTVQPESGDVFLYPTGMAGLSNMAEALQQHAKQDRPVVAIFGFLYVDTVKMLQKVYDFETTLYGHASSEDLDALEEELSSGRKIHALICEFPGNPLLQSPDLKRLHQLAKQHSFWLVVDDTVGTFVNLAILPHCDMISTSLTKIFSGRCNVMGGSLVLNPHSQFYRSMHTQLTANFMDTYFPPDAFVMEANSRDFAVRVRQACKNAEVLCNMLRQHPAVTHVYYPQGSSTQPLYDACRRPDGLYGYLFSVTFVTPAKAVAFHDALDVAKGPSLGTDFSLACAYTLLAHYNEREWAAQYGVVEYLVRMSVGLEDLDTLSDKMTVALNAAQTAE